VFALVLFQAKPRFVRAPDFPWGPTREEYERETEELAERRGGLSRGERELKGLGAWPLYAVTEIYGSVPGGPTSSMP
jgi:hypothetical protein